MAHTLTETQMAQATKKTQALTLVIVCVGYFMVVLDTTIVNVALPAIQSNLGASVSELQWIVDGYVLAFACLLLTAGALGDRFGARQVFLLGIALFTAASILCGEAPTIAIMIVARIIQGIGAALIIPATLALVNEAYPDSKARARAVSIWGAIASLGLAVGPLVGGILVDTLGWRSIFMVNIPFGIAGIVVAWRFIRPSTRVKESSLDLGAQFMAIITLAALTAAFIEGKTLGWNSPFILGAFIVSLAGLVVFLLLEHRAPAPMLPLKLFANPTFTATNVAGLLLNFGFYGQIFILSLFFQQARGLSSLETGLAFLPLAGSTSLASALIGRFASHTSPRLAITCGLLLSGIGSLGLLFTTTAGSLLLTECFLFLIGSGVGLAGPQLITAMLLHTPQGRAGIAGGVLNAARQTGGALGVALLGIFISQDHPALLINGLHIAAVIAGAAFLAGWAITVRYVTREQ
ncbi:MFS transporter [Ktedonosporobacter rubrisoli]|nr:MFS transporter [Ktedonosporobacter rubrisoli]